MERVIHLMYQFWPPYMPPDYKQIEKDGKMILVPNETVWEKSLETQPPLITIEEVKTPTPEEQKPVEQLIEPIQLDVDDFEEKVEELIKLCCVPRRYSKRLNRKPYLDYHLLSTGRKRKRHDEKPKAPKRQKVVYKEKDNHYLEKKRKAILGKLKTQFEPLYQTLQDETFNFPNENAKEVSMLNVLRSEYYKVYSELKQNISDEISTDSFE